MLHLKQLRAHLTKKILSKVFKHQINDALNQADKSMMKICLCLAQLNAFTNTMTYPVADYSWAHFREMEHEYVYALSLALDRLRVINTLWYSDKVVAYAFEYKADLERLFREGDKILGKAYYIQYKSPARELRMLFNDQLFAGWINNTSEFPVNFSRLSPTFEY